ncbi:MAG: NUDIX domain-containing protein [Actinobacteria bacterium]|nr:NUDIX domain-containing protein [Actinomycetota bacterium]
MLTRWLSIPLRSSLRSMLTRWPSISLRSMLTRLALNVFRRLPPPIRRHVVHAGTPNFTVGAVLLLRDDNERVLLVRQRHTQGWSLPGGLLGHSETPEAAVLREVTEELAVQIDPDSLTAAVPHALVNPQKRRVDIVFTAVLTARSNNTVTPDGIEILEARWFAADGLPRCTQGTYLALTRCGVATPSR